MEPVKSRSPLVQVNSYLQACREIQWERPDDALEYAVLARKTARQHRLRERELHSLRMMGICHYAAYRYTEALDLFQKTLPGYRRLQDLTGQARALQNIGMALRALGRNEEALKAYSESKALLEGMQDGEHLCQVLINIGSTHTLMNKAKEGLEAFSHALAVAEQYDLNDLRARITGNIADIYKVIGDLETSADWSQRSLALHRANADTMGVGLVLTNMGSLYQQTGDLAAAQEAYTEALAVTSKLEDDHLRARSMIGLSQLYVQKKRYSRAEEIALEASEIFHRTTDPEREIRCLHVLFDASLGKGAFEEAARWLRKAQKLSAKTDNEWIHVELLTRRGLLALALGKYSSAQSMIQKALRKAKEEKILANIAELHRLLSRVYSEQQQWQKALIEERRAADAQHTADSALRAQHSQSLELRLQMERNARERERVREERDRLQHELEMREKDLNTKALSIAQKNELLSELSGELSTRLQQADTEEKSILRDLQRKIESHKRTGQDWKKFSEQLAEVHEGFFVELSKLCPALKPTELRIASLLKINLSSKEIAEVLNISYGSVDVYRHRLRKKLNLGAETSLTVYLQSVAPS